MSEYSYLLVVQPQFFCGFWKDWVKMSCLICASKISPESLVIILQRIINVFVAVGA
jgi:hypothetical protein